jgi:hypothetical protein
MKRSGQNPLRFVSGVKFDHRADLDKEDCMPTTQIEENDEVILVDLQPAPGVRQVSLDAKDLAEKSKMALDNAMKSVRGMAKKAVKTLKDIPISERPTSMSVSFGLKLTAEGNAVVAKAGAETSFTVTMSWEHKK